MLKHLRIWWRLYLCLILAWMARYFLPQFLQGATSETGQTIYGWLTYFDSFLSGIQFIGWLTGNS